jgi:hypothetical protein
LFFGKVKLVQTEKREKNKKPSRRAENGDPRGVDRRVAGFKVKKARS